MVCPGFLIAPVVKSDLWLEFLDVGFYRFLTYFQEEVVSCLIISSLGVR
jgi:hypothetical protein